jgi:DNA polymerase III delta prime subunit
MEILTHLYSSSKTNGIPHILFYGETQSGKRTLLNHLLSQLYEPEDRALYCMYIECSTSKGIKVVRDDIKEFAKQQVPNRIEFKSVILYDAENMTIDAQYSLRRCIEIYSKHTRFFIVTVNKDKLLNPICSRFFQIYCPKLNLKKKLPVIKSNVKKILIPDATKQSLNLFEMAETLYRKGVYGDMLMRHYKSDTPKYIEFAFSYDRMARELRNETWILYMILREFH